MTQHLFHIVEGRYDTSWVKAENVAFLRHDERCSERTVKNMRSGSESGCTCGHGQLQVHAWPARAGEGVLCWAEDGAIYCVNEDPSWAGRLSLKFPLMNTLRNAEPTIREAWERLLDATDYRISGPPSDGLYAFVDGEMRAVEDVTNPYARWLAKRTSEEFVEYVTNEPGSDWKSLLLSIPGKVAWVDRELLP